MNNARIEQAGPPAQVYEHPGNQFVAQFLGSANLILASRESDQTVQTALGKLQVSRKPPWQKGTLAIRPERILAATEIGMRLEGMPHASGGVDVAMAYLAETAPAG